MSKVCVCYTTDVGYLFPSLISAIQARRNTSPDHTDIFLIGIDIDPAARAVFSRVCEQSGIIFQCHDSSDIQHAPAMLARLFLSDLLPTTYDRFLYVDGDTQIRGNLDRLLTQPLPSGTFAAVTDPMGLACGGDDQQARTFAAHFAELGLSDEEAGRYFNSGVIYAEREGWSSIGPASWAAYQAHPSKARFPDQDVLNLIGRSHRLSMSFAWNFPIFFRNIGLDEIIEPCIYHFMSSPKPWDGNFIPWDATASTPYGEIAALFPELVPYWKRMSWKKHLRYHLQQRYKRWQERREWSTDRIQRIRDYERDVDLKC
ncbi:glycosyltransferase family 8 protein [Acetobacter conturbans]|uniref:Glycosyl transferase family 8 n=1 Tax=Acetobacter conturbans TaxID=1737472 RepID=A0ABX0K085_9PROT|nr:glycosyltransferase [Acetobacter conturbans]NHN89132.1 glycosyl transferase family 8 [Acetobacter conturbans]